MINTLGLPIHHLGVALDLETFRKLTFNLEVNDDKIQGVQTYFKFDQKLNCFIEYFTISGRAQNYSSGFHHVCYNVKNEEEFKVLQTTFRESRIGFQITNLENSGSTECNKVAFFFLKKLGIVEFNVCD